MDDIDKKIIEIAQLHGRASYNEFGEAVGLSVSAINERLKKLQSQGVIRGWTAQIDSKVIGLEVLAFIYVQIDRPNNEKGFSKRVNAIHEIIECHYVTGEWSYLMKVRTRTISELETVLSSKIKSLNGVMNTHTVLVLSSSKDGSPLIC
jgi:Lrp/AsnC family transcriptional regulator, leucine-responsive regulatory protein